MRQHLFKLVSVCSITLACTFSCVTSDQVLDETVGPVLNKAQSYQMVLFGERIQYAWIKDTAYVVKLEAAPMESAEFHPRFGQQLVGSDGPGWLQPLRFAFEFESTSMRIEELVQSRPPLPKRRILKGTLFRRDLYSKMRTKVAGDVFLTIESIRKIPEESAFIIGSERELHAVTYYKEAPTAIFKVRFEDVVVDRDLFKSVQNGASFDPPPVVNQKSQWSHEKHGPHTVFIQQRIY